MTVIAVGLYLIGRAGVFERWFVAAITVALAAVGAAVALRSWRRPVLPRGRLWWALVGTTALALLLDLVAATAPPSSADALK
jgi:hydrogenase/urease accessory protein HupE